MTARLELPERLDTEAARALTDQLLSQVGQDLELDATHVSHIGALCLQVLVSAAKTCGLNDQKMAILNVSDALAEQLFLFGFTPETLSGGTQ